MYAIVKTGGKQYTVKPGDVLDVEKLEGEAGDQVALDVIFLNDGKNVVTDAKALAKVNVTAEIVDQHKGDKQIVFKFKKRKGYKRTRGHRQQLTRLCIVDVNGVKADKAAKKADKPAKAEKPAKEEKATKAKKAAAPAKEQKAAKADKPAKAEKPAKEQKAEKPAAKKDAKKDVDLSKMTVAELKDYAKEQGIKLPSGARKADIIETIQNA